MSDQLKVDLDLLRETGGMLALLMEEFQRAGDIVDEAAGAVGGVVADALHDFADDWAKHREHLLSKMDVVHQAATKGRQAYVDVDDQLARDIGQAKDETHIGGGR